MWLSWSHLLLLYISTFLLSCTWQIPLCTDVPRGYCPPWNSNSWGYCLLVLTSYRRLIYVDIRSLWAHFRTTSPPIAASDPLPQALSSASAVFLVTFFDPIRLTILDLIRLNCFYLIRINCFSIWLESVVFPIWFDSGLTYSFLVWATQFESHSSQASGSPTLARVSSKTKYWKREIFHHSENLNWFWQKHSNLFKNQRIGRRRITN